MLVVNGLIAEYQVGSSNNKPEWLDLFWNIKETVSEIWWAAKRLQFCSIATQLQQNFIYVQSAAGEILVLFTFREWVGNVTLHSFLSPLVSSYSNLHWLGTSSYSDFDKGWLRLINIQVLKGWISSRWCKEQIITVFYIYTCCIK